MATISRKEKDKISRKRSTMWNFIFLNVGFLITLFNGLLIIPLYLHYIDASLYGAWLATGNILTWITIIDPGVAGVLLQRVSFSIGENNKEDVGLAITSGIVISGSLFFLALAAGYGLSFFLLDIARIDKHHGPEILNSFRIAMWGTAFSLLADTFRNIILAYQKTKLHGILLYSVLVAGIFLNVVLLVLHTGVYALAYTALFKGAFTLLFAGIFAARLLRQHQIRLKFDRRYFVSFSKIFSFTFTSSLFETIANNVDLILVSRYLGSSSVTVLDLCRRPIRMVCSLANNVTISMLPSLPHLFGSGDQAKIKATVTRVWHFIFWMSGLIIGGFLLFNHSFVSHWVGGRFWIGTTNNLLICGSIFLWTIGYNLSNITLSMGDIRNNALVTIVRSIAYIAALLPLVKLFGMPGAAAAFLVPSIIMVLYYPRKLSRTLFDRPQEQSIRKEAGIVLLLLLAAGTLSWYAPMDLGWPLLVLGSLVYGVVFMVVMALFSPAFKKEIKGIQSMWNKIKRKVKMKFVDTIDGTPLQFRSYRAYWHAALFKRHTQPGGKNEQYLFLQPNPGAGIGHQLSNWNTAFYFAGFFGLHFAHSPFSSPSWENLLGLGVGEPTAKELMARGYQRVLLPKFDAANPAHLGLIGRIIDSYGGKKILFSLETDQGWLPQYETAPALQRKFFGAPARSADKDRLIYSPGEFNVAIHIRRGDIVAMRDASPEKWRQRWLDDDYYVNVLNTVLPRLDTGKKVVLYIFSQGLPKDFVDFLAMGDVRLCLDMNAPDSFLHLVHADLLISSKSSFSYKPALISKGIKLCPRYFWHQYPATADFILADNEGNFDAGRLGSRLHHHTIDHL